MLCYKHDAFIGPLNKIRCHNREFELHPGDCIFVYTDGVPEATNTDGDMFREERLNEVLNQNADAEPEELTASVYEAVKRFAGGAEQFDDITMLCFRYNGTEGRGK